MNFQENYARIERAIRFIQTEQKAQPSLDDIAAAANLSKFHFQRLFIEFAGVSPKTFLQYLTLSHAKKLLAAGKSSLNAAYAAGLSGSGRLHDLCLKIAACPPGQIRSKTEPLQLYYSLLKSPFGLMFAAESEFGLCHLRFVENENLALAELKHEWPKARCLAQRGREAQKLEQFLAQGAPENILLDLRGTKFQIKVWEALLHVPTGQLASYGSIAEAIGNTAASRAVGSAIGKNPIALLIPCHRVLRETAEIGNYRWGSPRKAALIAHESAICNTADAS